MINQYSLISLSEGILLHSTKMSQTVKKTHNEQQKQVFYAATKINFNSNDLHYSSLLVIQWEGQYNFLPS